ncbi:MAG: hypothetical protein ABI597_01625 [Gammaproteobacteria bacterium]
MGHDRDEKKGGEREEKYSSDIHSLNEFASLSDRMESIQSDRIDELNKSAGQWALIGYLENMIDDKQHNAVPMIQLFHSLVLGEEMPRITTELSFFLLYLEGKSAKWKSFSDEDSLRAWITENRNIISPVPIELLNTSQFFMQFIKTLYSRLTELGLYKKFAADPDKFIKPYKESSSEDERDNRFKHFSDIKSNLLAYGARIATDSLRVSQVSRVNSDSPIFSGTQSSTNRDADENAPASNPDANNSIPPPRRDR